MPSRRSRQVCAVAWLALILPVGSCGSGPSVEPDTGAVGEPSVPPEIPIDTVPTDSLPPVQLPPDSQPQPQPNDSTPPVPPPPGIPFGAVDVWIDSAPYYGPAPFTMSMNFDDPLTIIPKMERAHAIGHRLILVLAGGNHGRYITDGKFVLAKWIKRMEEYNTPTIRAAIEKAIANGTVVAANVMDEPNNYTWGGVMTKPLVDTMAAYVKQMFPTLTVGVSIRWDWRLEERYKVIEFIVTHYAPRNGGLTEWRDGALQMAKDNGISILFAINPLNNGDRVRGCPLSSTGGPGTWGVNCRMTPGQIKEWGAYLGVAGCGLVMWKYEPKLMSRPENVQALKDLGEMLGSRPTPPPCRRH